MSLTMSDNSSIKMKTVASGGSEVDVSCTNQSVISNLKCFVLKSRRSVAQEFPNSKMNRTDYERNPEFGNRNPSLPGFEYRLNTMMKNKSKIDPLIKKLLGYELNWTIDKKDSGSYYMKITDTNGTHSGEGLGDGVWGVIEICDALYDSEEGSMTVIDEPELSLHPSVQKRVLEFLKEYSKDRQIVLSTHSPYFVDWHSIVNGAKLIRVVDDRNAGVITAYPLSRDICKHMSGLLNNLHNPHILGLDAKEIFFLEDNVILVEGQDDVVMYNKILDQLDIKLNGTFYGWGVGGADNMSLFLKMFKELGYKHVVAIFDNDKEDDANTAKEHYPDYHIEVIPAPDVRDKKERKIEAKQGLVDESGNIHQQYKDELTEMMTRIMGQLSS